MRRKTTGLKCRPYFVTLFSIHTHADFTVNGKHNSQE